MLTMNDPHFYIYIKVAYKSVFVSFCSTDVVEHACSTREAPEIGGWDAFSQKLQLRKSRGI